MADVSYSTIHVINGKELGETPQVFVQPAGKRSPRSGETLVLFLDLQLAQTATLMELAQLFSDAFWKVPGGLTTALRLAIKLANDRLVDMNRGAPPSQRILGSISCAVANDESVIIAQAGPAIAYARAQSGAFEHLVPEGDVPPVGSSRTADAVFTNYSWKPGDNFVLTGSSSCAGIDDELVNACMRKGDGHMVAGYLNANVKQGKLIGVAFSVGVQPAPAPAGTTTSTARTLQQDDWRRHPARQDAAPSFAGASTGTATSRQQSAPTPQKMRTGPSLLARINASTATLFDGAAKSMRHSLGVFGNQLLPASLANAPSAQRSRTTVFGLAAVAILLPIIVALAVTILYFQLSGDAERQQLRDQTRQQIELAKSTSSIENWSKALGLINSYETKYPDDVTTFLQDRRQGQAQVDQVNKIARVAPATITELPQSPAPRRIAAASLGIYVLDLATDSAVYDVLNVQRDGITGKPVPLTLPGGTAPVSTGRNTGDIVWATTSTERWHTEGAVLFNKTALYEYSSATGQLSQLVLPSDATANPDQVTAGELFNGTAYILDAGAGQIWRFTLQGNKLVKGDTYFRSPNSQIKDSVDMAIDGAVYLVLPNGTVMKYYNRQQRNFSISSASLPEPIGQAVAIGVSGLDQNTGNVFIADARNGAVWEFTKTGDYVKQFRGSNNEFVGMQDMSVDPTSNTIYVNTPTKIYSFKFG
ncbi:MAG: hypothetical protein M1140_07850 [Chloroflexi bacterium]|nr:hypothetical protein [Chloroflexota bacterium]